MNTQEVPSQMQMFWQAHDRLHTMLRTFNEIQTGPNPLTRDEVRRLIDKRPAVYGCLEKWATQV